LLLRLAHPAGEAALLLGTGFVGRRRQQAGLPFATVETALGRGVHGVLVPGLPAAEVALGHAELDQQVLQLAQCGAGLR
jgi:hypothetical protein